LIERGQVLLLDWEMFGLGDPALDVARLLQREAQSLTADQVEGWLARYLPIVDQPAMAERIDIFQRLLEVHNGIYLLVGLQQHATGTIDNELRTAMPFMQNALSTALERAASALLLPEIGDAKVIVADFIQWLLEATPVTR
jgi:aminoglycoside phosphotransferase (APT) family kinase protein